MKRPDKRAYNFNDNIEACQYGIDMGSYCNYLEDKLETTKPVNVDLADVMFSVCNDYVDGINMDCAKCGEPKYKHLT